jgi:hypothetical protein
LDFSGVYFPAQARYCTAQGLITFSAAKKMHLSGRCIKIKTSFEVLLVNTFFIFDLLLGIYP